MVVLIDDIELFLKDNIDSVKKTLNAKINKIDGLNQVFFESTGGVYTDFSFSVYLVEDRLNVLNKLDEIIKAKKPVTFMCFEPFIDCKILITSKSEKPELFTKIGFSAKEVSISGYLIDE